VLGVFNFQNQINTKMKKRTNFLVLVILCTLFSCAKPIFVKDAAWEKKCKGVLTLGWQTEIQGADAATSAKIITDITLAAKADAKKSEDLKGEAALNANLKSEFAKAINENVSKSSKVSDDFWEQVNTFSSAYCLSVSLLDRNDIPKEKKLQIVDDIRSLQLAETQYFLNKEKKSGNSPK
jgi:hypothetical protein